MQYYYDINLHFDDYYMNYYEWSEFEHFNRLPIFKVISVRPFLDNEIKLDLDYKNIIVSDGIVPMGHPKENIHNTVFDASNVDSRVTAWVIYNKNMDYLHCPEKLGWDKAQSCK